MATLTAVRVRVEGRPAPKGSRIQGVTRKGRMYTRPASKHEAPWVRAVKQATELAMRHHAPMPPPYAVHIDILVPAPRRIVKPWPSQHDLDKLVRSTVDGLVQGKALDDDRHVIELHVSKRFVNDGEASGAIAVIASVPT